MEKKEEEVKCVFLMFLIVPLNEHSTVYLCIQHVSSAEEMKIPVEYK